MPFWPPAKVFLWHITRPVTRQLRRSIWLIVMMLQYDKDNFLLVCGPLQALRPPPLAAGAGRCRGGYKHDTKCCSNSGIRLPPIFVLSALAASTAWNAVMLHHLLTLTFMLICRASQCISSHLVNTSAILSAKFCITSWNDDWSFNNDKFDLDYTSL